MPRAALSAAEISSFRDRACDVALDLFAADGADVSMRSIAAALGVSPMTPYRYFRNKEELLAAVRTLAFRRFADRQHHAFGRSDARTRLSALAAAYIGFARDEPSAYKVMFELEQTATDDYPMLESEQRRAFSLLVAAATESIHLGRHHGDPVTVAHLLWAQIHGLVSLHLAGKLIMGRSFDELCNAPTIAALGWRES